ncbi:MAG: hypothetical protein IJF56_10690, partial [Clostridia bacterium]|nr:hypothetical protein [Clostridia bacterium]
MKRAFHVSFLRMILPLALLLALVLTLPGTAMAESRAYQPTTVEEAVEYLAAQCTAAGMTDDYDIAVWMHDWLIYNADYDETLVEHRPDGVLLYGTGVCESYTLAYSLLLDRMGIPNKFVESPEMEHIWNLVQLDGEWVHVDCTWDDPVPGGAENHSYFGMNDALMSRDHTWDKADLPASTASSLYYPLYQGMACVSSQEELETLLTRYAEAKQTDIEICYIGADASFGLYERFMTWFYENNWKYGLSDCLCSYTGYQLSLTLQYTDPWEKPSDVLDTPVNAPAFSI